MRDILYQSLIEQLVDEAVQQEDILGVLLIGSVARGDALPGSDLDLRFIVTDGNKRAFQSELRNGIMVEQSYADVPLAQSKLDTSPMEVYAYLDGRILFDPTGIVEQLTHQARERFETYQLPERERDEIAYWLNSVQLKLRVALNVGDMLKAAYLVSTSSWPILRGLWAANEKPLPPNGAIWVHLKDLSKGPNNVEAQLSRMFCRETQQRVRTALELLEWILAHLSSL